MSAFVRSIALVSLIALVTVSVGCYRTEIVAPPNSSATLAPKLTNCTPLAHKRVHYLLAGLIPIGDNTSEDIVPAGGTIQVVADAGPVDVLLRVIGWVLTASIYSGTTSLRVNLCR
jgi:hypothetical protein